MWLTVMLIVISGSYVNCSWQGLLRVIFEGHPLTASNQPELPSPFGDDEDEDREVERDHSLDCTCGISNFSLLDIADTVVSEKDTHRVSWLAFIYIARDETELHSPSRICSGTIINDRVIVTAASCLVKLPTLRQQQLKVLFNKNLTIPEPDEVIVLRPTEAEIDLTNPSTFTKHPVEYVTVNPFHISSRILHNKYDWDIAFIQLQTPLIFNDETGFVPICVPAKYVPEKELEGTALISLGWTKTTQQDRTSGTVQPAVYSLKRHQVMNVHPKGLCRAITVHDWISDRSFCTDGPEFMETKFIESHGGPMVMQEAMSPFTMTQYGIVSWDFIGTVVQKHNVRISTHFSGFLQVIDDFSNSVDAQWCSNGASSGHFRQSAGWDGGLDIAEPFPYNTLTTQEWKSITANYRQYYSFSECKCGALKFPDDNDKQKKYNWQVEVLNKLENGEERQCSGSLINNRIVLITASCSGLFRDFGGNEETVAKEVLEIKVQPKNLQVRLRFNVPGWNSSAIGVASVIPHVKYRINIFAASDNDVALVILENPIPFPEIADTVSPICLPEYDYRPDTEDQNAFLVFPSDDGTREEVRVDIYDTPLCKMLWTVAGAKKGAAGRGLDVNHFDEYIQFQKHFCAGSNSTEITKRLRGNGEQIIAQTFTKDMDNTFVLTQIGFSSKLINTILKPILGKRFASTRSDLKDKMVMVYRGIQEFLSFIDYFSLVVDAKWCPASGVN